MNSCYRRLTYHEQDGAWGLKGANLLSCPPAIYGAAAKLCKMESLSEAVACAKTRESAIYELQCLVDEGLGGRFVDLEELLEVCE